MLNAARNWDEVTARAVPEAAAPPEGARPVPPELADLGARRQDTLESRVRDGKLELSEADVVRLALENNVDAKLL